MSKSILVIDTPEKCRDCPVIGYCRKPIADLNVRQEDCPLREMPEKYSEDDKTAAACIPVLSVFGYYMGYNECIDEILKGKE